MIFFKRQFHQNINYGADISICSKEVLSLTISNSLLSAIMDKKKGKKERKKAQQNKQTNNKK